MLLVSTKYIRRLGVVWGVTTQEGVWGVGVTGHHSGRGVWCGVLGRLVSTRDGVCPGDWSALRSGCGVTGQHSGGGVWCGVLG